MWDVLVGHLVGDYLWQNDWMAAGKKKSSLICAAHVATYTLAVMMFARDWSLPFALGVAVPHFLIDRWGFVQWYMRKVGQERFMQAPLGPWSVIVVDNVMHLLCLHSLLRVIQSTSL